ncbi:MAG: hypothetical protein JWO00_440 [Candidatus Parcubacteria bacterium]|nr:hypothetical protein [Candidatus Parcubacteria bacterium]
MKLCYFGIYDPEFGRNKVYMSGLRQNGVEIVECRDTSRGAAKFFRLWRKHEQIVRNGGYDALIVGYPGHILVPFAQIISRKPVIFDALATIYEGEVISRGKYSSNPFMKTWVMLIDWLSVKCADAILVETKAQKDYFVKGFSLDPAKVHRVFTGVDEPSLQADHFIPKRPKFTAVFRGKFLPEAGVKYIVQAAKALEKQDVDVLVIGNGFLEEQIGAEIDALKPLNLFWIPKNLPAANLYYKMQECHVSLGQFENHDRLERTIPHKAFESLALGLPYVTGRAKGISELLIDGKNCLMTDLADPDDIAAKILQLKNQPELASEIGRNGRQLFDEKLTARILAKEIMAVIVGMGITAGYSSSPSSLLRKKVS